MFAPPYNPGKPDPFAQGGMGGMAFPQMPQGGPGPAPPMQPNMQPAVMPQMPQGFPQMGGFQGGGMNPGQFRQGGGFDFGNMGRGLIGGQWRDRMQGMAGPGGGFMQQFPQFGQGVR